MTLDNDGIAALLEQYDRESRAIKNEALRMTWWMRGGLSYSDALNLSLEERGVVNEIIKENIENTKKSGMPML